MDRRKGGAESGDDDVEGEIELKEIRGELELVEQDGNREGRRAEHGEQTRDQEPGVAGDRDRRTDEPPAEEHERER